MGAYRENRRADKVPRLHPVSRNEAAEATDEARTKTYVEAREKLADERRALTEPKKRSFGDLLKKK